MVRASRRASRARSAPWDGESEPARFARAERSGLLTRAAFLVTGSHETNPVLRGAIIRRRLLCQELTAPSPSQLPPGSLDPPEFRIDMTTRQRYEEKTKNEPCASCHAPLEALWQVCPFCETPVDRPAAVELAEATARRPRRKAQSQ